MEVKSIKIFCDECKFEFSMDSVNIQNATIDIGGKIIHLTYFTCPKCNKIYRISITDNYYFELKEDLEKMEKRIRKNHGSNNIELASVLGQMMNRKLERLRNHAEKLNKKFPGTFVLVVSENNHEEKHIKYLP